jgi:integrase
MNGQPETRSQVCDKVQKRQSVPEILTVDELVRLLSVIHEPFRTAVFLDGSSGLRVGELLGLKWEDVDFKGNVIHIRRSIVKQKIGPPKTEASQKPIPLNAALAKALRLWKMKTIYNRPHDYERNATLLAQLYLSQLHQACS